MPFTAALFCPGKSRGTCVDNSYPSTLRKRKFARPRAHFSRRPISSVCRTRCWVGGRLPSAERPRVHRSTDELQCSSFKTHDPSQSTDAFAQQRRTFLDPLWPFESPALCSEATSIITGELH